MLKLIKDFTPLLKKYGKKLKRGDGFEELCASFISIVYKIPLSKMESSNPAVFISYLATAVKNEYCCQKIVTNWPFTEINNWRDSGEICFT